MAQPSPLTITPEVKRRAIPVVAINVAVGRSAGVPARCRAMKCTACVDLHATHIARLNPFDERLRDIRVAKACD
jgi:hypothetical protein